MVLEWLQDYPVQVEIPVAWGEMDSYGHVNNIIYFRYFESARIHYFARIGLKGPSPGPILARAQCRFRAPLTFPDTVSVGVRVTALGEDRFTQEYCLVSHRLNKIAAQGEGLIVAFDYDRNEKSKFLPETLQAIERLEGRFYGKAT